MDDDGDGVPRHGDGVELGLLTDKAPGGHADARRSALGRFDSGRRSSPLNVDMNRRMTPHIFFSQQFSERLDGRGASHRDAAFRPLTAHRQGDQP